MAVIESIPVHWYSDPTVLAAERRRVLRAGWQYVGPAAEVAEPGSYSTADLAGLPIVITRDVDGTLRGFANVCRHRGAVVAEGCGRRKTLQCMYHGWTYRLDGTLHRTPGMEVEDDVRLAPVAVAEFGPLLFACGDPGVEPLAEQLRPFAELVRDVACIDIDRLVHRCRIEHSIDANWKAVVENFIECYHCPLVHSETLPGYGDEGYRIGQIGPLHTQDLETERFCFAYLYPCSQLSAFGAEHAFVARAIQPDGPDRTRVALDYWFLPEAADDAAERYVAWFEHVIGEDKPWCEATQRGLASGAIERGLLNPDAESGLCEFHKLLVEQLGDAVT